MPTVFGDEFKGAGQKAGLEIWRIEKLKCVKKLNHANPKDNPPNAGQLAHAGKLCSGDSYIFLHTVEKSGSLERKIYYWRGKESSQDEYGTMAYKTVELDESLGGEPSQHMEVQGHETPQFKSLFKGGVSYIEGGVDTGFKSAAEATAHKNRLLHVKGKRNVSVMQVEYSPSSMNEGDVFILDLGTTIYQWNGKECSRMEKQKAMEATRAIRDQERGGKASVFIVEQDNENSKDLEQKFWEDFGHSKPSKMNAATDDAAHETQMVKNVKLYHLSDASGSLTTTEITDRPLKKDMLLSEDAFILEAGSSGVFAWVGKGATKAEKTAAMTNAQKFVKDKGLPDWTPIARYVEGGEAPTFKQYFAVWPEPVAMPMTMAPGTRVSKFKKQVFDPKSLHAKREQEQMRLPKEMEGSGELEVFRIENIKDLAPVKKNEYGQFYAGDSYVICYKYKTEGGKEAAFIYFWQGLKSTQDEKAASAIQAKEMDDAMGGYPVQVRVVMNKEPPHFFKIFENSMVVHTGGIGSGFKNVDQADEYDTDGVRLFQVRGTNDYNTRAVQVEERAASLNSGDVFILETPEQMYIWNGKGCSGDEREFAKKIVGKIHGVASKNREPEILMEGSEPENFWKCLGVENPGEVTAENRPAYGAIDYGADDPKDVRPPRLFQCSDARGYFWAEEVFDFDQEDLIVEDCMLLDTFAEVYVWIGEEAKANEKEGALNLAKEFIEAAPERDLESTTILMVKQGFEPPTFTCHFIGWDDNKWRDGKTYEQLCAEMMAGNPDASAADLVVSVDDALKKYVPGGTIYTYAELTSPDWEKKCEGVRPDSKEQHLSDEEFGKYFKTASGDPMTKAEYAAMPQWKAINLKKKAKLF